MCVLGEGTPADAQVIQHCAEPLLGIFQRILADVQLPAGHKMHIPGDVPVLEGVEIDADTEPVVFPVMGGGDMIPAACHVGGCGHVQMDGHLSNGALVAQTDKIFPDFQTEATLRIHLTAGRTDGYHGLAVACQNGIGTDPAQQAPAAGQIGAIQSQIAVLETHSLTHHAVYAVELALNPGFCREFLILLKGKIQFWGVRAQNIRKSACFRQRCPI